MYCFSLGEFTKQDLEVLNEEVERLQNQHSWRQSIPVTVSVSLSTVCVRILLYGIPSSPGVGVAVIRIMIRVGRGLAMMETVKVEECHVSHAISFEAAAR